MKNINYNPEFYNDVQVTANSSAAVVVPLLIKIVQPKSVVDVGCGSGAWLKHFQDSGCEVRGFDGPWVEDSQLLIPKERFTRANLEEGINTDESFDLAISLEVAEHLPEKSASLFVSSLCKLAPVVCFSAAIPGQGGTNHLNEQWQSYWIEKFAKEGYECFDVVRPEIWQRNEVAVHYCQNSFVFAKHPIEPSVYNHLKTYEIKTRIPDLVHPRVLADKTGLLNCGFRKFFFGFLPLYIKMRLGIR